MIFTSGGGEINHRAATTVPRDYRVVRNRRPDSYTWQNCRNALDRCAMNSINDVDRRSLDAKTDRRDRTTYEKNVYNVIRYETHIASCGLTSNVRRSFKTRIFPKYSHRGAIELNNECPRARPNNAIEINRIRMDRGSRCFLYYLVCDRNVRQTALRVL